MTDLDQKIKEALRPGDNGFVAVQPFPIDKAPRDGRLLRLLVNYEDGEHPLEDEIEAWTIGFNNFDNDAEDCWKIAGWCWSHDHFTEGRGLVVGWLPYDASLAAYVSADPTADGSPEA